MFDVRTKKRLVPVFIALFLMSCSTLRPRSFDQGWAAGMAMQTSVLQTATSLRERQQITKEDATRVLVISDQAGHALDSAKALRGTDMAQAQAQLALATTVLDQIVAYLNTRKK